MTLCHGLTQQAEAVEGRDGVLACRRCILVVGLLPSKAAVGGGQQTVSTVSEMRKKRLVRFSLRPCRYKIINPQPVLGEGQARSVFTRLGNRESCDGKRWKFLTSGTRSKAPAPSVTTEKVSCPGSRQGAGSNVQQIM